MLTLYVVCAVVGVGLALVAAVAGDHTHDGEVQADFVHDLVHDADTGAQVWLPFLSLRFWTYGLGGFGLTGMLLTMLTAAVAGLVLGLALAMGVVCGSMVSIMVRLAQLGQSDSSAHSADMLGADAKVLVAIRPGAPGKVRFSTKGEVIDMIAIADDGEEIEAGRSAILVALEGDKARVVARDLLYEEPETHTRS